MTYGVKSILIEEKIHKRLKDMSEKSGMKMKVIVESAIIYYLNHMVVEEKTNINFKV